jgi:hypothetical protein
MRVRPNECFSGRGHRTNVCKQCMKIPRDELFRIESLDRIWDFVFSQSRISGKNIAQLTEFAQAEDPEVRGFAEVVLELARIRPHRRRRYRGLQKSHPELWQRLRDTGILEGLSEWDSESLALLDEEPDMSVPLMDFDPNEEIPF